MDNPSLLGTLNLFSKNFDAFHEAKEHIYEDYEEIKNMSKEEFTSKILADKLTPGDNPLNTWRWI